MFSFWGKSKKKKKKKIKKKKKKKKKNTHKKNAFFKTVFIFSLTKFLTSSLCACEQLGAPHWKHSKGWHFCRNGIFTIGSKVAISENWLQILKIVQSIKLRPKRSSFWTLTTRPQHPTEQVQTILQPEISIHFAHFRFELKISEVFEP